MGTMSCMMWGSKQWQKGFAYVGGRDRGSVWEDESGHTECENSEGCTRDARELPVGLCGTELPGCAYVLQPAVKNSGTLQDFLCVGPGLSPASYFKFILSDLPTQIVITVQILTQKHSQHSSQISWNDSGARDKLCMPIYLEMTSFYTVCSQTASRSNARSFRSS